MIALAVALLASAEPPPPPPSPALVHYIYYFEPDVVVPQDVRYAALLTHVAERAVADAAVWLTVDVHEDAEGSAAANLALTQKRGSAVRDRLIALGVPAEIIVVRAKGERQPAISAPDGVAEPLNRFIYLDYGTRRHAP